MSPCLLPHLLSVREDRFKAAIQGHLLLLNCGELAESIHDFMTCVVLVERCTQKPCDEPTNLPTRNGTLCLSCPHILRVDHFCPEPSL